MLKHLSQLLLGGSPLLTGFLSGLSHQKEHIIAKHPFINNENRHSYPMAQSQIIRPRIQAAGQRTGGSGGQPRLLFQTASLHNGSISWVTKSNGLYARYLQCRMGCDGGHHGPLAALTRSMSVSMSFARECLRG